MTTATAPLTAAWAQRSGAAWARHYRDESGADRPHRRALLQALPTLEPVRSVFEVGCGAGANLHLIRAIYPTVNLTGVDINLELLQAAITTREEAADPHTTYVYGDLLDTPIPAVSVAFSCYALAYVHVDNITEVVERMLNSAARGVIFLEPTDRSRSLYLGPHDGGVPEWAHPYQWLVSHFARGTDEWLLDYQRIEPPVDRLNACVVARRRVPFDHHPTPGKEPS